MSDVRINIDIAGNIETPTLVLKYRNAKTIGVIDVPLTLNTTDSFGNPTEFSFTVYKNVCSTWDYLIDYRLIWIPEWNKWFTITVELSEGDTTEKTVHATSLPESDLGQLNLYNVEINTEDDMLRDDYDEELPTLFYRVDEPKASLLNRVTEKAVNFKIIHVDESLASIQNIYEFTFDNISIYDALLQIAEEVKCIFIFDAYLDDTGRLIRTISAYDLQDWCPSCNHRADSMDKCDKCGNGEIVSGYGENTNIFLSVENALGEANYSTNVDSLKNCFKLEAGDEIMSAYVAGCNPTGTDYLWHFSEDMKKDMSPELCEALDTYQNKYDYYESHNAVTFYADAYNALVTKYSEINEETGKNIYTEHDLSTITMPIIGNSKLTNILFDTLTFNSYLTHQLMPFVENKLNETTAALQLETLIEELGTVAVSSKAGLESTETVKGAILSIAKVIVDSRYETSIQNITHVSTKINDDGVKYESEWKVLFTITNSSNEDDTITSSVDNEKLVVVNTDQEIFMQQKIDKQLSKGEDVDYSIVGLFSSDLETFKKELTKYGLTSLNSFREAANGVLSVLIEQGVNNKDNFPVTDPEGTVYYNLYLPYYEEKLPAIEAEIAVRESEIAIVDDLTKKISKIREEIAQELDLETCLGELLWSELNSFRREDTYSNPNYISDGRTDAERFEDAKKFFEKAKEEIQKASTLQHTISVTLKNIFTNDSFAPLRKGFKVGNWLRIGIEDKVYKLRLLSWDLNYDDYENMTVDFSDVERVNNAMSDVASVISNMHTISTSFSYVQNQVEKTKSTTDDIDSILSGGLDLTNTNILNDTKNCTVSWDKNGLLCREYDDITETYLPEQMKLINTTLALTTDNWRTVKTAIGKFYYIDPNDPNGEIKTGYGINGETLVGKIIIGETLSLQNGTNSLRFDENGLSVYNTTNKVMIDPTSASILTISKGEDTLLSLDENGDLSISGYIHTIGGDIAQWTIEEDYLYSGGTGLSSSTDRYAFWAGETNEAYGIKAKENGSNALFTVMHDGKLHATDATITGDITATKLTATHSGSIACWTFDDSAIYKNENVWNGKNSIYFGTYGLSITDTFSVSGTGKMVAKNASIIGDISATSITAKDEYCLYSKTTDNNVVFVKSSPKWTSIGVPSLAMGICKESGNNFNYRFPYIEFTYADGYGGDMWVNAGNSFLVESLGLNTGFSSSFSVSQYNIIADSSSYIFRVMYNSPDEDGIIYQPVLELGSDNNETMPAYLRSQSTYERTYSRDPNVYITSYGTFGRVKSSSSRRYKHDIKPLDMGDVEALYNLPVITYKYNEDYLSASSERYLKDIPGFIAEDVEEINPVMVDHLEDGRVEVWNTKIMIPCLLRLIQNDHQEIEQLKEQIKRLTTA